MEDLGGKGTYVINKLITSRVESCMVYVIFEIDEDHFCPVTEVSYAVLVDNGKCILSGHYCKAIPFQLPSARMLQSLPYHVAHRIELKTNSSHIFLLFGSFPAQGNDIKSFSIKLRGVLLHVLLTGSNHQTVIWKHYRSLKGDTTC